MDGTGGEGFKGCIKKWKRGPSWGGGGGELEGGKGWKE